jgi:hypothetical protein
MLGNTRIEQKAGEKAVSAVYRGHKRGWQMPKGGLVTRFFPEYKRLYKAPPSTDKLEKAAES